MTYEVEQQGDGVTTNRTNAGSTAEDARWHPQGPPRNNENQQRSVVTSKQHAHWNLSFAAHVQLSELTHQPQPLPQNPILAGAYTEASFFNTFNNTIAIIH